MTAPKLTYPLREAADIASVSVEHLRAAIRSTDDTKIPHLKAKFLGGRAGYRIKAADLHDWIDRWRDA